MRRFAATAATVALGAALATLGSSGCSSDLMQGVMSPNQRPTVGISQAPRSSTGPATYACEISWAGFDADGRVASFRYAIDPPAASRAETLWVPTPENRGVFSFRSDSVVAGVGHDLHTFVVEAIDDRGLASLPAWVAFDATTIAPRVTITNPIPTALLAPEVPTALRISWAGDDPDGFGPKLPASYRYRLFNASSTPPADVVRLNPDTLRTLYAPSFAGWDSLPGTATGLDFRDLTPGQSYLFVIVALDIAGAWSAVFSPYSNMLQFRSGVAGQFGPKPSLWNDSFRYDFPSGGINLETATWPGVAFAAGSPIALQWSATTSNGTYVSGMRWALDPQSVDDETPRADEQSDLQHWSRWSNATTILLPAMQPPPGVTAEPHLFYLEVVDNVGLTTLVGLRLTIVRATFTKPLLVIDDTAFRPDRRLASGCTEAPGGAWPTAAELDTFLYAVGNVPWRCYPSGTNSAPGLLAGYDFDTLGTHSIPESGIPLGQLGAYRNIVWIVDGASAVNYNNQFNSLVQPMPLLRALCRPGTYNSLAVWLQMGGRLWVLGGGASYASLRDFDDQNPTNVFSYDAGELVAGRFMYSYAHWQSEATTYYSFRATRSGRAVGGWAGAPDYSRLPSALLEKTAASDPVPPGRAAGVFYQTSYYAEYLSRPNAVLEPRIDIPGDVLESTLDTLYVTQGGTSGTGWPVMTLYHGRANPTVVFSGFPVWYFQRAQGIAVTDFVLQQVFGMSRRPVPR